MARYFALGHMVPGHEQNKKMDGTTCYIHNELNGEQQAWLLDCDIERSRHTVPHNLRSAASRLA